MDLTLPPEMERFVADRVNAGQYPSASSVVEEAVRRLMQSETAEDVGGEDLRRLIAVGQADLDRGDHGDSEEVFEEIRQLSARRRGEGPRNGCAFPPGAA